MRCPVLVILIPALVACSPTGGPYPSLAARPAETIDPRVPIASSLNDRPASAKLVERLARLVSEARSGDTAFLPAAQVAARLAAGAGPARSESWIVAQEALSAAIAARAPTARAMGDVDGLAATMIRTNGGIAPNDLKAIEEAAATIRAIDTRQSAAIADIRTRLAA